MSVNVYEIVTNRIIEQLEKGIIPWKKPWVSCGGAISRATGKPYNGINQMLLNKEGEYLTFKQVSELGGKVKKGAKSSFVVFWKMYQNKTTDDEGNEVVKNFPVLRYYNVFHIDDCEGIEAKYTSENIKHHHEPIEEAERVKKEYIARTGIKFYEEASDRAFYSPAFDEVVVPQKEQFESLAEFYSTVFHELTHSTGSANRLNRITSTAFFGNEEYSKEELVAEIGAASILNELGIETESSFKNSSAYIQNWIKALRNDTKMIVSASSKAGKAVDMILNREIAE